MLLMAERTAMVPRAPQRVPEAGSALPITVMVPKVRQRALVAG